LITIGIDPGARYTGVSVRDGNKVLLSSTFVKPEETPIVSWAVELVEIIKKEVIAHYRDAPIGIEGISAPKGFAGGKKAPINPKYIINAGIVLGSLAQAFPNAVIVKAGRNGKQDWYPGELEGRRPKDLPGNSDGAGTRNHERSAFDVAGEVPSYINNGYMLDNVI
jgi:hypothetical protein